VKNLLISFFGCALPTLFSANLFALDGVRIAAGGGEYSSEVYKISLLENFDKTWFSGRVKGHWELGFSHWDSDSDRGTVHDVQAIGFAPVFIYDFGSVGATGQPYLEYSVGLLYMNEESIGDNEMGQRWQFDNRVGVGVRFGPNQRHDLSISIRHVSNASTDEENDGFNSGQIAYTYHCF
jgi:lipid A 3-O-deacylase